MKKIISLLLAVMLAVSVTAVSTGAVTYKPADSYTVSMDTPTCEEAIRECNDGELGDVQRVYFQLPSVVKGSEEETTWTNRYNSTDLGLDYCQVCAFWWSGIGSRWPDGTDAKWVGYRTKLENKANRIYEATVPADGNTPLMIWNNGVNGGMDKTKEIFNYARQLADANIEGAEPGDFDTLPEGSPDPDSMDGCIAIIKYTPPTTSELIANQPYAFDWYVYYGDGCYGEYPESSENYHGREESCVNPEHFHIMPGCIYFDAASAGWENASSVSFYIYEIGGEALIPWGSKRLRGTKKANNIWEYDATAAGVEPGKQYGLIVTNGDTSSECCALLMDTSCFGDTVIAQPDEHTENPVDSHKTRIGAKWKNSSYGQIMEITSIGNVVGETIPGNTTAYQMMVNFLASNGHDSLLNALNFNGKDAQTTIDDIGKALGLQKADVVKAIEEARTNGNPVTGDKIDWSKEWDPEKSTLPGSYSDGSSSGGSTSGGSSSSSASSYTAYPKVTVKNAADGLEVAWSSVRGVKWYRVFVKSGGSFKKLMDVMGNGFVATNVKSGTKYTYTVRALSADRKVYASDYMRSGVSCTYIAAPKISVSNAPDGVTVKWSRTGAAKYRVFVKNGSSWKKLTDTAGLSYTHTGVTSGKTYTYTVRCISKDGKSYTSAASDAKKITFISAPKFTLSNTKSGVKIAWSKVAGAKKYRVFIKSGKTWKKLKDTAALTVTDTAAKAGRTYTYTVRCISADGKKYTGASRAGKSIVCKK